MQAARAHRLNLGGVRLHGEELHVLAGHVFKMLDEGGPDVFVDRGVFDGGIGENQRRGGFQHIRIGRRIGDQIAIGVAEHLVQGAALAILLREGKAARQCEGRGETCGE